MSEVFLNRVDAGHRLAGRLTGLSGEDVVVLGLPRGGVPVAAEVARGLGLPLDVILVRKLGLPFQPELAMGAIGEEGVRLLDRDLIERTGITPAQVATLENRERAVLLARAALYRPGLARLDLTGRAALVVDDGIATGATASAACLVARSLGAIRVTVAAPVGGPSAVRRIHGADEVMCLIEPPDFTCVGAYYQDFAPTSDTEVVHLLQRSRDRMLGSHR
jgi:predicted phosphoribosyltransferase